MFTYRALLDVNPNNRRLSSPPGSPQTLSKARHRRRAANLGDARDDADIYAQFQRRGAHDVNWNGPLAQNYFDRFTQVLREAPVMREKGLRERAVFLQLAQPICEKLYRLPPVSKIRFEDPRSLLKRSAIIPSLTRPKLSCTGVAASSGILGALLAATNVGAPGS